MAAKPVYIVNYDPSWPRTFEELSAIYDEHLQGLTLAVEHVGSTSVPNLAAKPIIDIHVVIPSMEVFPEVVQRLAVLGYFHEGDLGLTGREAFAREGTDVPRDGSGREWPTHYLYVCPEDSQPLAEHLLFRDYLRNHPEAARDYALLKKELAEKYRHDRKAYGEGKTQFVRDILEKCAAGTCE